MVTLIMSILVQVGLTFRKMGSFNQLAKEFMGKELLMYADSKQYDLTNAEGLNVLMIACVSNYFDVVKIALNKGFNLNERSLSKGKTPLMYAVRNGEDCSIAEFLVESGADVNVVDNQGRTVLFDAIKRRREVFYDLIINDIQNVNHRDKFGVTPLMIAAYEMNIDKINKLLDRGADAKIENKASENTYDIARKYMHTHIRVVIESKNDDEGSAHNTTTSKDVLNAQKHNHEVRELVRRLECLVTDREYKYKKFKRPFFKTGKAN